MDITGSASPLYGRSQPDDSVIREIHQALRNLSGETAYKRDRLKQLTRLLSSCLVKRYVEQHPSKQVHHALRAVLTSVLDTLGKENPKYALLLSWRFWKGSSIREVLTEGHEFIKQYGPMSERRLFTIQNEAIKLFAIVFSGLEDLCNKELAQVVPPTRSSNTNHIIPSIKHKQENDLRYTVGPILPPYNPSIINRLTRRELQMLIAYSWGYMTQSIAQIFSISENTVRRHLQNAREKLGARTITHALWIAGYYKLLEPYEADVLRAIEDFFKASDYKSSQE